MADVSITFGDNTSMSVRDDVILLNLSRKPITDLTPLSRLTNLQSLALIATPVSDLTPLSGLTKLKFLDLERTQIANLDLLSGLTSLESLDLGATPVSVITPLSGLTNLKSLSLRGTQVRDIAPLSGLTNLRRLYLPNITDEEKAAAAKRVVLAMATANKDLVIEAQGSWITARDIKAAREAGAASAPAPTPVQEQLAQLVPTATALQAFFSLYPASGSMDTKVVAKLPDRFAGEIAGIPDAMKEAATSLIQKVMPQLADPKARERLVREHLPTFFKAHTPQAIVAALQEEKGGKPIYGFFERYRLLEVATRYDADELVTQLLQSGAVFSPKVFDNNEAKAKESEAKSLSGLVLGAMLNNSDNSLQALAAHYGVEAIAKISGVTIRVPQQADDPRINGDNQIAFDRTQIREALSRVTGIDVEKTIKEKIAAIADPLARAKAEVFEQLRDVDNGDIEKVLTAMQGRDAKETAIYAQSQNDDGWLNDTNNNADNYYNVDAAQVIRTRAMELAEAKNAGNTLPLLTKDEVSERIDKAHKEMVAAYREHEKQQGQTTTTLTAEQALEKAWEDFTYHRLQSPPKNTQIRQDIEALQGKSPEDAAIYANQQNDKWHASATPKTVADYETADAAWAILARAKELEDASKQGKTPEALTEADVSARLDAAHKELVAAYDVKAAREKGEAPAPVQTPDASPAVLAALAARTVSTERALAAFFSLYPNSYSSLDTDVVAALPTTFAGEIAEIPGALKGAATSLIQKVMPQLTDPKERQKLVQEYLPTFLNAYSPQAIAAALQEEKDGEPIYSSGKREQLLKTAARHDAGELVLELLRSRAVYSPKVFYNDDERAREEEANNMGRLVWNAMLNNSDSSLKALATHYGVDAIARLNDVSISIWDHDQRNDSRIKDGKITFTREEIRAALLRATGKDIEKEMKEKIAATTDPLERAKAEVFEQLKYGRDNRGSIEQYLADFAGKNPGEAAMIAWRSDPAWHYNLDARDADNYFNVDAARAIQARAAELAADNNKPLLTKDDVSARIAAAHTELVTAYKTQEAAKKPTPEQLTALVDGLKGFAHARMHYSVEWEKYDAAHKDALNNVKIEVIELAWDGKPVPDTVKSLNGIAPLLAAAERNYASQQASRAAEVAAGLAAQQPTMMYQDWVNFNSRTANLAELPMWDGTKFGDWLKSKGDTRNPSDLVVTYAPTTTAGQTQAPAKPPTPAQLKQLVDSYAAFAKAHMVLTAEWGKYQKSNPDEYNQTRDEIVGIAEGKAASEALKQRPNIGSLIAAATAYAGPRKVAGDAQRAVGITAKDISPKISGGPPYSLKLAEVVVADGRDGNKSKPLDAWLTGNGYTGQIPTVTYAPTAGGEPGVAAPDVGGAVSRSGGDTGGTATGVAPRTAAPTTDKTPQIKTLKEYADKQHAANQGQQVNGKQRASVDMNAPQAGQEEGYKAGAKLVEDHYKNTKPADLKPNERKRLKDAGLLDNVGKSEFSLRSSDNNLDPTKVKEAAIAYQEGKGLKPDGYFGSQTIAVSEGKPVASATAKGKGKSGGTSPKKDEEKTAPAADPAAAQAATEELRKRRDIATIPPKLGDSLGYAHTGEYNEGIKKLTTYLKGLGYDTDITGHITPRTVAALQRFRKDHANMYAGGVPGAYTTMPDDPNTVVMFARDFAPDVAVLRQLEQEKIKLVAAGGKVDGGAANDNRAAANDRGSPVAPGATPNYYGKDQYVGTDGSGR